MMDEREIRLRCIEAAAKSPIVHNNGPAAGVVEVAGQWAAFVLQDAKADAAQDKGREILGLPKKK